MARSMQSTAARDNRRLRMMMIVLFCLSSAGLAYQIALTRVFSLIYQYHYVFLVVSIATLGLGVGAALTYGLLRNHNESAKSPFIATVMLTAVFLVVAVFLAGSRSASLSVMNIVIVLVPFLLIGWINAIVYWQFGANSTQLYGADLFGAVAGLILGPVLLPLLGPFGIILAMGVIIGLAALILADGRQQQILAIVLMVGMFAVTLVNHSEGFIAFDPAELANAPPDKTMVHVLNDSRQGAEIMETRWGSFAQIDVVKLNDPTARYVFTDGGAGSLMLAYDPDQPAGVFDWFEQEIAYTPFLVGPVDRTLIIGAGAGYDILMANHAGAESITAVEVNPTIIDVTRDQADYNGGVLDLSGVTTVVADGRNFIDRTNDTFDTIYLNFVYSQAAQPGVSALSENYIFTTEALQSYYDHLSDDGVLGFVSHTSVHGLRLLMTAARVLQESGDMDEEAALGYMVLMHLPNEDPTITPSVLLVKKQPWTPEEVAALYENSLVQRLEPQHVPFLPVDYCPEFLLQEGLYETGTPYCSSPLQLGLQGQSTLADLIALYDAADVSPTTDNQPYFYHFMFRLPHPLDRLLIFSMVLAGSYFIISALTQPKKLRHEWLRTNLLAYFALIGIGFMLAEVSLLQYFRLLIGDPVLAFSVTLGTLLLGAGLGSLFSQRFRLSQLPRVLKFSTIGVAVFLLAGAIAIPLIVQVALPASLFLRITVISLTLLLPGFLMGFPFANGLRLATEVDKSGIALFWGMNAVASTLGGVLASAMGLLWGLQATLLGAAILYFCVALLIQFTWQRVLQVEV
jgi:predicted membrane-bound spermidine synthase